MRPGRRLLDVGCGPGALSAAAAARGLDAVGLDAAEQMLAHARGRYPNVHFAIGSAEGIPFPDGSFDVTVANFVLLHLSDPAIAVGEWARVTAPGGRVALTVWNAPGRNRLQGLFLDAVRAAGAAPPPDLPPARRRSIPMTSWSRLPATPGSPTRRPLDRVQPPRGQRRPALPRRDGVRGAGAGADPRAG